MHLPCLLWAVLVAFLTASLFSAHAEMNDETRSRALNAITDTADKICRSIPMSGETHSTEVKGAVTTELNGLAKKLIDLGISGAADIKSTTYEGLLQQDLQAAFKDERGCRMHIFDTLQQKFFPEQQKSEGSLGPIDARLDNIEVGKPIITNIGLLNTGKEPRPA